MNTTTTKHNGVLADLSEHETYLTFQIIQRYGYRNFLLLSAEIAQHERDQDPEYLDFFLKQTVISIRRLDRIVELAPEDACKTVLADISKHETDVIYQISQRQYGLKGLILLVAEFARCQYFETNDENLDIFCKEAIELLRRINEFEKISA